MPPHVALLLLQPSWRTYTLGGMTLSLPAAPQRIGGPGASSGPQGWRVAAPGGNGVVILSGPAVRRATGKAAIQSALTELLRRTNGRVRSRTDTTLGGWPALRATIHTGKGNLTAHLLIAQSHDRLIILSAGGAKRPAAAFANRVLTSVAFASTRPPLQKG